MIVVLTRGHLGDSIVFFLGLIEPGWNRSRPDTEVNVRKKGAVSLKPNWITTCKDLTILNSVGRPEPRCQPSRV